MITLYACKCSNAVPLIRRVLRENHYQDWYTAPIVQGKEACLNHLATLPENRENGALAQYITRASSWSIIQASPDSPHPYKWVDVGHATVKDRLDAEILLEEENAN